MKLTKLAIGMMAAGLGMSTTAVIATELNHSQSADVLVAARAGTDTQPQSAADQANIPGQSLGATGHPGIEQSTGQGQGVLESTTAEPVQPQAQVPEQSMSTVGHPEQSEVTGQGEGVREQSLSPQSSSTMDVEERAQRMERSYVGTANNGLSGTPSMPQTPSGPGFAEMTLREHAQWHQRSYRGTFNAGLSG